MVLNLGHVMPNMASHESLIKFQYYVLCAEMIGHRETKNCMKKATEKKWPIH